MPAGRVAKKSKSAGRAKHSKPSRRQTDEDLSKLQTLDRTIQEHQKAQFYGVADAQLDFKATKPKTNIHSDEKSIKALENLTKVERKSERQSQIARRSRDLHALDGVLETLRRMDFASSQHDRHERSTPSMVDEAEIDI